MSYTKRPLEDLNVMDDFLINALACNPEIGVPFCRTLLSVLLQRPIGKITITAQKVIPAAAPDKRGIRMDVVIEEFAEADTISGVMQSGTALKVYDLEAHIPDDTDLFRHNRFYQAKTDSRYLKSGVKDFGKLPELYVITLTNYDPFGYGYMMYTVKNQCVEVPEINYADGLYYIYFYTGGTKGGCEEIRKLLEYLKDSRNENAVTEATREIHEYVSRVKVDPEMEAEYMKFDDLIYYTQEKGRKEGFAEGRASDVCKILESKFAVSDSLREKISLEKDTAALEKWLLLAVSAKSIEEFEAGM